MLKLLYLTDPASRNANPPCIKKTMMPIRIRKAALRLFRISANSTFSISVKFVDIFGILIFISNVPSYSVEFGSLVKKVFFT